MHLSQLILQTKFITMLTWLIDSYVTQTFIVNNNAIIGYYGRTHETTSEHKQRYSQVCQCRYIRLINILTNGLLAPSSWALIGSTSKYVRILTNMWLRVVRSYPDKCRHMPFDRTRSIATAKNVSLDSGHKKIRQSLFDQVTCLTLDIAYNITGVVRYVFWVNH